MAPTADACGGSLGSNKRSTSEMLGRQDSLEQVLRQTKMVKVAHASNDLSPGCQSVGVRDAVCAGSDMRGQSQQWPRSHPMAAVPERSVITTATGREYQQQAPPTIANRVVGGPDVAPATVAETLVHTATPPPSTPASNAKRAPATGTAAATAGNTGAQQSAQAHSAWGSNLQGLTQVGTGLSEQQQQQVSAQNGEKLMPRAASPSASQQQQQQQRSRFSALPSKLSLEEVHALQSKLDTLIHAGDLRRATSLLRLMAVLPFTPELLADSQIARHMRSVQKSTPHEELAAAVRQLLETWETLVRAALKHHLHLLHPKEQPSAQPQANSTPAAVAAGVLEAPAPAVEPVAHAQQDPRAVQQQQHTAVVSNPEAEAVMPKAGAVHNSMPAPAPRPPAEYINCYTTDPDPSCMSAPVPQPEHAHAPASEQLPAASHDTAALSGTGKAAMGAVGGGNDDLACWERMMATGQCDPFTMIDDDDVPLDLWADDLGGDMAAPVPADPLPTTSNPQQGYPHHQHHAGVAYPLIHDGAAHSVHSMGYNGHLRADSHASGGRVYGMPAEHPVSLPHTPAGHPAGMFAGPAAAAPGSSPFATDAAQSLSGYPTMSADASAGGFAMQHAAWGSGERWAEPQQHHAASSLVGGYETNSISCSYLPASPSSGARKLQLAPLPSGDQEDLAVSASDQLQQQQETLAAAKPTTTTTSSHHTHNKRKLSRVTSDALAGAASPAPNPGGRTPVWTAEEVQVFLSVLREHGRNYAKLMEALPHRPKEQIRNFFNNHKVKLKLTQLLVDNGHSTQVINSGDTPHRHSSKASAAASAAAAAAAAEAEDPMAAAAVNVPAPPKTPRKARTACPASPTAASTKDEPLSTMQCAQPTLVVSNTDVSIGRGLDMAPPVQTYWPEAPQHTQQLPGSCMGMPDTPLSSHGLLPVPPRQPTSPRSHSHHACARRQESTISHGNTAAAAAAPACQVTSAAATVPDMGGPSWWCEMPGCGTYPPHANQVPACADMHHTGYVRASPPPQLPVPPPPPEYAHVLGASTMLPPMAAAGPAVAPASHYPFQQQQPQQLGSSLLAPSSAAAAACSEGEDVPLQPAAKRLKCSHSLGVSSGSSSACTTLDHMEGLTVPPVQVALRPAVAVPPPMCLRPSSAHGSRATCDADGDVVLCRMRTNGSCCAEAADAALSAHGLPASQQQLLQQEAVGRAPMEWGAEVSEAPASPNVPGRRGMGVFCTRTFTTSMEVDPARAAAAAGFVVQGFGQPSESASRHVAAMDAAPAMAAAVSAAEASAMHFTPVTDNAMQLSGPEDSLMTDEPLPASASATITAAGNDGTPFAAMAMPCSSSVSPPVTDTVEAEMIGVLIESDPAAPSSQPLPPRMSTCSEAAGPWHPMPPAPASCCHRAPSLQVVQLAGFVAAAACKQGSSVSSADEEECFLL